MILNANCKNCNHICISSTCMNKCDHICSSQTQIINIKSCTCNTACCKHKCTKLVCAICIFKAIQKIISLSNKTAYVMPVFLSNTI